MVEEKIRAGRINKLEEDEEEEEEGEEDEGGRGGGGRGGGIENKAKMMTSF